MLTPVTIEVVAGYDVNKGHHVSGSFLQSERHAQVSPKYQVIQAASVGNALSARGFNMVGCLSGKGRHTDKAEFQRTIARYRAADIFDVNGLWLDVISIVKHLGRGCNEIRLGFFRGTCANQWNTGTLFDTVRFRHTGDIQADTEAGIAAVLGQRDKLVAMIKAMQATTLSAAGIEQLCKTYADIRLQGKTNVIDVNFRALARVRRADDAKLDLFTVANVLQENVIRFPLPYRVNSNDTNGNQYVRNQTTRQLRESSSQLVDLNGQLFDAAAKMIA